MLSSELIALFGLRTGVVLVLAHDNLLLSVQLQGRGNIIMIIPLYHIAGSFRWCKCLYELLIYAIFVCVFVWGVGVCVCVCVCVFV